MRKRWFWFAASIAVAAAPVGHAATVLEHTIVHTVRADGSVLETTRWTVRLDEARDLAAWSPAYVYLDEHRKLKRLEATSTRPGGKPERVKKKEHDTVAFPEAGTLASSATYRTVEFPPLPVGSLISLESEVESSPYFPAQILPLSRGEAVSRRSGPRRGG
jgi:hypothetical protein